MARGLTRRRVLAGFVGCGVALYVLAVVVELFLLTAYLRSEVDGPAPVSFGALLLHVGPGLLALAVALLAARSASAVADGETRVAAVLGWCAVAVLVFVLWWHVLESLRCTYFWRGFLTGSCRG